MKFAIRQDNTGAVILQNNFIKLIPTVFILCNNIETNILTGLNKSNIYVH